MILRILQIHIHQLLYDELDSSLVEEKCCPVVLKISEFLLLLLLLRCLLPFSVLPLVSEHLILLISDDNSIRHLFIISFHDSHDDLLLVDLFVETLVIECLGPVNTVIGIFLEAEDLGENLPVCVEHSHKIPYLNCIVIIPVEQAEQGIKLALIG